MIAGKDDPALADEAEKYGIDSQKLGLILDYLAQVEKLGVETHKENLQKTTEDAFKEREEKYKDDFDKEAEEPEGGFEAWQDEKEEEFEKDWQGKKEDWKETLNKPFGGKNHG